MNAIFAWQKSAQRAHAIGESGDDHRAMRNALIARHSDFEIDSSRPFYPQFHRMNLNVLLFMPDVRIKAVLVNPAFTPLISGSPGTLALRHKENLVGVRILHFRAGWVFLRLGRGVSRRSMVRRRWWRLLSA